MGALDSLAAALDPGLPVTLQTHDYPDIDAVAAAFGLGGLLSTRGFRCSVECHGPVEGRSLRRLLEELDFEVGPLGRAAQTVVVDGSPENGNVSGAREIRAIVDHHDYRTRADVEVFDVRPGIASSSSIVASYWFEEALTPPRAVATALLAGIQSDTDFFARRFTPFDFGMCAKLATCGDFGLASRIVRTVVARREVPLVGAALAAAILEDSLFFGRLPEGCGRETLAVVADFLMRVDGVDVAVLIEGGATGYHLSVRSKSPRLSAFALVTGALEGLGSGGGHSHAAGGFIAADRYPGDRELAAAFASRIASLGRHDVR